MIHAKFESINLIVNKPNLGEISAFQMSGLIGTSSPILDTLSQPSC